MSLPGGYTELEYIQSSGTQYLDSGVTFEKTDTVEFEILWTVTPPSSGTYVCGNYYMQVGMGTSGYGIYAASNTKAYGTKDRMRVTFASVQETLLVNDAQVFTHNWSGQNLSNVKLGILKLGMEGNAWYSSAPVSAKVYSCTIKKGGALVRNFIPCKNAAGVIGLWDDVNSVFYQNAGSGAFTAGPEVRGTHKTLIGGTAYEVKAGKCLINGTAYAIQKGRTLINGTGYDIALVSGTPISALPVGSTVKIAVNGTLRDFLVVNQGIPRNSSLYDDSCNGTWLLMKDCYEQRQWHSSDFNSYGDSSIHSYLNGTFLALVDSDVKSLIKQVKIPYRSGGGSTTNADSGASGLSAKIFLLSGVEVGLEGTGYLPYDGARLSYFNMSTGNDAKRVAYLNGSAATWWLRSPWCESGYNLAAAVETRGSYWRYLCTDATKSIRPAFVLPSETMVADDGTIVT